MQCVIRRASDLRREGRWDAEFHVAADEAAPAVEALKIRYSAEAAIEMVDALPLSERKALEVLRIGVRRPLGNEEAMKITRRYPHLSLALVMRDADDAIVRLRRRIESDSAALERIKAISEIAKSGA